MIPPSGPVNDTYISTSQSHTSPYFCGFDPILSFFARGARSHSVFLTGHPFSPEEMGIKTSESASPHHPIHCMRITIVFTMVKLVRIFCISEFKVLSSSFLFPMFSYLLPVRLLRKFSELKQLRQNTSVFSHSLGLLCRFKCFQFSELKQFSVFRIEERKARSGSVFSQSLGRFTVAGGAAGNEPE